MVSTKRELPVLQMGPCLCLVSDTRALDTECVLYYSHASTKDLLDLLMESSQLHLPCIEGTENMGIVKNATMH